MDALHHTLVDSIRSRRRLRFSYNGKLRTIEPQCYGIGHRGTRLLRAYQLQGGSEPEPLFDLAKMKDVSMLDETFTEPGPNYKKNDSAMATIFAQL